MKVKDARKILADRIQELMIEKKWNNKQLCAVFNSDHDYDDSITLTESKLSEIRRCKREPSYTIIAKLAHVFGVSCDYLLGISNTRTSNIDIKAASDLSKIPADSLEKYIDLLTDFPELSVLSKVIGFFLETLCAQKEALSNRENDKENNDLKHLLLYESYIGKIYQILDISSAYILDNYNLIDKDYFNENNSEHSISQADVLKYSSGEPIFLKASVLAEYLGRDLIHDLSNCGWQFKEYLHDDYTSIKEHYNKFTLLKNNTVIGDI